MINKAELLGRIELSIYEHEKDIATKYPDEKDPEHIYAVGNINGLREAESWVLLLKEKK